MYDLLLCWPGGYLFFLFTFFPSKTLLPCRGGQKRGSCPAVLLPDPGTVLIPHLSHQHSGIKSPSESVLNNWYFLSANYVKNSAIDISDVSTNILKFFWLHIVKISGLAEQLNTQSSSPVLLGWFQVHPIPIGYLIHYLIRSTTKSVYDVF